MSSRTRRRFLAGAAGAAGAAAGWSALIEQAQAAAPATNQGSLRDVQHIVVLMQENRSFDHLFGALNGVRGFADPFPLPLPGGRTVWQQPRPDGTGRVLPWHVDTRADPRLLRVEGTPHIWLDAQLAWDHGRMGDWPRHKRLHSMVHHQPADLPFHTALADAFTLCDAYHCSFQGGTHPNRLYLMTGCIDPSGHGGGPALDNYFEDFGKPDGREAYHWTTYPERLQAAGVSWHVYQDMADNFDDNALSAFRVFRDAYHRREGHDPVLRERAAASGGLERLRDDVLADRLPQVSWIVGTAEGSEHPGPSSPAQGADYVARVLQALTARPDVWARTVLLVNYDENDGWFDHVPPPAAPSPLQPPPAAPSPRLAGWAGGSTVDTTGEYHWRAPGRAVPGADLAGHPYGLGPRVPLFVVSPWSRGGWVCSDTFDHTSVIRFIEARFGVTEPNISPWRRAVCGDLTSAFDFRRRRVDLPLLPDTGPDAVRARTLPHVKPVPPAEPPTPAQPRGPRPARPLGLQLAARLQPGEGGALALDLANTGRRAAVVHVVDRLALHEVPRRLTLDAGTQWHEPLRPAGQPGSAGTRGAIDLWLLGANGWHRHFLGADPATEPLLQLGADARGRWLWAEARNPLGAPIDLQFTDQAYGAMPQRWRVAPGRQRLRLALPEHRWYDWVVSCEQAPAWRLRAAGHAENGAPSLTDPAMHGPALLVPWAGNGTDRQPA